MNTVRLRSGFTLLEMSIVLVIIAIVVGGGMTIFGASVQKRQLQETQAKLKAIQKALYDFRIANNRLPCPTDATANESYDWYFGTESPNPGFCIDAIPANTPPDNVANFSQTLTEACNMIGGSNAISGCSTASLSVGMPLVSGPSPTFYVGATIISYH